MVLSDRVLAKEKALRAHMAGAGLESQRVYKESKYAYEVLYKDLPMWERTARSMAYAFEHQIVDISDGDEVIGRYNFKVFLPDSDPAHPPRKVKSDDNYLFELSHKAHIEEISKVYPEMRTDFLENGIHGDAFWNGHEAHAFQVVLHMGWQGMRDLAERMLARTGDEKSQQYYKGLIITIDGLIAWNDRHAEELERRGMTRQAEIVRRVPRYPARSFREAVQCVNMVYFTVTQEGSGTYGPGWIDYYLWPYLEKDLKAGAITEQEAFDLCGYLLIQMDSRIALDEEHNDTVNLGGSHPNGTSAVSKLTYMFAEAVLQLDITCLLVYLKMPENPPEGFVEYAADWLMRGRNRGQVLSDKAIAGSLEYRGTPYWEALSYTSNGCMEISCSNANSDLLLCGWHNMPKFVELSVTGNRDLVNGKRYPSTRFKGLCAFADFESYYRDFLDESQRILRMYFDCVDRLSAKSAIYRPTYYASALLSDCMLRGRNMSDGGTRYNDYGTAPVGLGTAADSLFAIKKAVFDDGIVSQQALVQALERNFEGDEKLRLRLRAIPKYGQDNDEADAFARRYMDDICAIYESYENRLGGVVKPVVFTFVWANKCAAHLGAMADGSFAHTSVSHGTTPATGSMTAGATAAILSNCKMPMHRFSGGGSSMWDFDPNWINKPLMHGFLSTFLDLGGQMFQGNSSSDPAELIKAQQAPGEYQHLIVRVGGFSARFVDLTRDVQDDIIQRQRHNA